MQALLQIKITTVDGLDRLATLATNITYVEIDGIPEPIQVPRIPAHVTEVRLDKVDLTGPVVFGEGINRLVLVGISSERPLHEWVFPASLELLSVVACDFETIQLAGTRLRSLELIAQETPDDQIFLPATLEGLDLSESAITALPHLPESLRYMGLMYCPDLRDYSNLREVAVTTLFVDNPPPLYEYFPQLETLEMTDSQDPFPEISLTHLKKLSVSNCQVRHPIEVNAPNLETLILSYTDRVTLRGCFMDTVTKIILEEYDSFPEGDDWTSLEELKVIRGAGRVPEGLIIEVPPLPFLKRMTLERPIMTNGVEVHNLREYKAAWGQSRRKKRAVHA